MKLQQLIKQKRIYLDGGTGTVLQSRGLEAGIPPEMWNIQRPDEVTNLHLAYFKAGSNIVATNTFGVNCEKYENYKELISAAMDNAKRARDIISKQDGKGDERFIALDIGPTGKMLKPLGNVDFEDAVEIFAKTVREGAKNGADLILIETMNDTLEAKAAVVAAKENCDLPIFVTCVFDESARLMTGACPEAVVALLEGLGVDAIGTNCSLGPDKMLPIVERMARVSSTPIIVKPNAGLPVVRGGATVFDKNAEEFSDLCAELARVGASIIGGCCGTTDEYIRAVVDKTRDIPVYQIENKRMCVVSSYTHTVEIGKKPYLIGERINPTGKSKLKEALRCGDMGYILSEAMTQQQKGAHILDVNVGLPEIDEVKMMKTVVEELQSALNLPLQIDTSDALALEGAMRIYNGKPLINSVSGKKESMDAVFPLVRKYGGVVIALTLDENGIPKRAQDRVSIAQRILDEAQKYGLSKNDMVVDPLAMAVSSDKDSAMETLKAIQMLTERGFYTSLGVSNISFGLPSREKINSAFFTMALQKGLSLAIMNPSAVGMTDAYYAHLALSGLDEGFTDYIAYADGAKSELPPTVTNEIGLEDAIVKGLRNKAKEIAAELVKCEKPLDIINTKIIPALDKVGKGFEEGKVYLPGLLMSAESASGAFEIIKERLPKSDGGSSKKIILATVKGDIHDIGKNIVKVLLESYGFNVIDLGRDVEPQLVVDAAKEHDCDLVGLSALMTTTVPAMEKTIKLLCEQRPSAKTVVGGAVLTEEYAKMINADVYARDAMDTVRFAEKFYK